MEATKKRKLSLSLENVFDIFWCLIVILFSGSPYQTIFSLDIVVLFIGLISFFLALVIMARRKFDVLDIALLIVIAMTFITMTSHLAFARTFYWRFLSVIFIAYYVCRKYSFEQISKVFTKIMYWSTIISLFGYLLVNTTSILDFLPKFSNINDIEYGIGIIFNYIVRIPERNCGIFWEPGIFATYLIIAIAFEIMTPSEKNGGWHILIFVAGLFTANSSAGYLLAVVCLVLFLVTRFGKEIKNSIATVISVILLLFFIVLLANLDAIILNTSLAENEYIIKLLSSNLEQSARVTVIAHNFEVFLLDPLVGPGIETVSNNLVDYADISTLTYALSIFGILGLSITVFVFKGIFSQKNINIHQKIIFIVIIVSVMSKEPHLEMPFMWILIFSLMNDNYALGRSSKINNLC